MKLYEIKTGKAGVQELVDALHQAHRTTQASVAETMCKALAQWAEESDQQRRTDLRNERAVRKIRAYLLRPKEYRTSGDLSHLNMYVC